MKKSAFFQSQFQSNWRIFIRTTYGGEEDHSSPCCPVPIRLPASQAFIEKVLNIVKCDQSPPDNVQRLWTGVIERLTTWMSEHLANVFTASFKKNGRHNCSIHDGYCKVSYSTILEKFRVFSIRSDMKNYGRWLLWKNWCIKRQRMLGYIRQVIFDSVGKIVILFINIISQIIFVYSNIYESCWFLLRFFKKMLIPLWYFNFLLLSCIFYYCFYCICYHQIIHPSPHIYVWFVF